MNPFLLIFIIFAFQEGVCSQRLSRYLQFYNPFNRIFHELQNPWYDFLEDEDWPVPVKYKRAFKY